MNSYRITARALALLALTLLAGCASLDSARPIAGTAGTTRNFDAPIARVKPAFVSTLASMGMMISSLEVRGGHEVIKARKADSEVEIELEPTGRTATRARVAVKSGGLLNDEVATRIIRQAERILGGT